MSLTNGILSLFSALSLLVVALVGQGRSGSPRERQTLLFYSLIISAAMMCICFGLSNLLPAAPDVLALEIASNVLFYLVLFLTTCFLVAYLHSYVPEQGRIPILISALSCALALGEWIYVYYLRRLPIGPTMPSAWLYWLLQVPGSVAIAVNVVIVFRSRKRIGTDRAVRLTVLLLFPFLSSGVNFFVTDLYLRLPLTIVSILGIHAQIFRDKNIRLAEQEHRLRIETLNSISERVRPHYIYNVLTSIYYLVESDPNAAQEAISEFSDYLRSTLDVSNVTETVRFDWELRLIRHYVALEQMRFRDRFSVEYQIEESDFYLPPFTVQLLVENAIKHGAVRSEGGGRIRIRSSADEEEFLVTVTDNGPGTPEESSDHKSLGLGLARQRLEMLGGGSISVRTVPGEGTIAEVRLPRKTFVHGSNTAGGGEKHNLMHDGKREIASR